jgi:Domain of Unknown Function (DUF1080)
MKSVLALALSLLAAPTFAQPAPEVFDDAGFRPLFDGRSLAGWHATAQSSHSGASQHKSGGRWEVVEGAIAGTQDIPGNGGILLSDEAFGDVEIALEARIDFGVDSGLFLRSSEAGEAYQVTIDYLPGGSIAGVYGEALPGNLFIKSFELLETPERIRLMPAPFPSPVTPAEWPKFWQSQGWNAIRARISGDPPRIIAWINGVRFMDVTDDRSRRPHSGALGLQVHGGGDHIGQFARFRNIRVKRLD